MECFNKKENIEKANRQINEKKVFNDFLCVCWFFAGLRIW